MNWWYHSLLLHCAFCWGYGLHAVQKKEVDDFYSWLFSPLWVPCDFMERLTKRG